MTTTRSIAVIGAGFSGTLLAVQLLRRAGPADRIYLFDASARIGRGLAYSTGDSLHLLNVRVSNMSAFPDEPDHFLDWLHVNGARHGLPVPEPFSFVPRKVFGDYVGSLLRETLWGEGKARNFFLLNDEVVSIQDDSQGLRLVVDGGRSFRVDVAVLATGNEAENLRGSVYQRNPWSPAALAGLEPDDAVLFIGSGLTMVDLATTLIERGHNGPLHALSRRGLLPQAHLPGALAYPHLVPPVGASPLALLGWLRSEIGTLPANGNWRDVVDALRPYTQQIWLGWTTAQRAQFLRHLRPYWEVRRHRMAPRIAKILSEARSRGQLRVHAGRILDMKIDGSAARVSFMARGGRGMHNLTVARIVDCTGPRTNYEAGAGRLLRGLMIAGLARPDPLRLGLDVDLNSAVIGRKGKASGKLFAVGPVTRGTFWEIIAVPDIRVQCADLARYLTRG